MNDNLKSAIADRELADLLELKRRRGARADLNVWAGVVNPTMPPALHHRFLNEQLERVERGEVKKLMVFLPPGSAKSTYSSVHFPPIYLGRKPNRAILACSHSADLANSFGRRCRNLVETQANVLGYSLSKDSKAADFWTTTNNGQYKAAGVGMGIAGFRADLGLIDDPIGKKEDADSKLVRDTIWDWYNFDFKTRLKPGASVVLIQTRWHEDDLAGRLLASEANEWTVVSIPLVAIDNDPLGRAPGDLLWPEWFNENTVTEAKKDSRAFNSLYQNNPTPENGNYFSRESLQTYTPGELPKNLRYYAGSDHAVSTKQEADLTCLMVVGVDESENIYVMPDLVWAKLATDVVVDSILDLTAKYRPIEWWAERGHISASIGPFLSKRMVERNVFLPITEVTSNRDKATRAQSMKGRMNQRKVFWPKFVNWWPAAEHELLSFPVGSHDDLVDALSEIGQGLDKIVRVHIPVIVDEKLIHDFIPTLAWVKKSHNLLTLDQRYRTLDR